MHKIKNEKYKMIDCEKVCSFSCPAWTQGYLPHRAMFISFLCLVWNFFMQVYLKRSAPGMQKLTRYKHCS